MNATQKQAMNRRHTLNDLSRLAREEQQFTRRLLERVRSLERDDAETPRSFDDYIRARAARPTT